MDENNMFENQNGQDAQTDSQVNANGADGNNAYQDSGNQPSGVYPNGGYQPNNTYQNSSYQQNNAYHNSGYSQNNAYQNGGYQNNNYQPYNNQYQQYQPYGMQPPYNDSGIDLEEPVKIGEWVLTFVIMMVPCVNIIMMFVWAFSSGEKKSKSNFFKAYLIFFAIMMVLMMLFSFAMVIMAGAL